MSEYRMKPDGSEDVLLTAVQTGELADGRKIGAAAVAGGTSELTTMQDGATGTGNGTSLSVTGFGGAAIQLSGTFVATVTFEGTANGSDWVSLPAQNVATGAVATTASSAGVYVVSTLGLSDVRARISAYTSGNVTAKGRAIGLALQSASVQVTGSLPAGTNNIGDVDVLSVNGYSGAIAGATGAAVPAGAVAMGGSDGTNLDMIRLIDSIAADGITAPTSGNQSVAAFMFADNGTTKDRWRNNTTATLLSLAARTAATNSSQQTNYNARGVLIVVQVTVAGTGTLNAAVRWNYTVDTGVKDNLHTPLNITGTGQWVIVVYPGIGAAGGDVDLQVSTALPRLWDLRIDDGDGSSWTYSADAQYIL